VLDKQLIVKLTITFSPLDLDEEEQDKEVRNLLQQMRSLNEVNDTYRVLDSNPPDGNKSFGGFLPGLLMAEVTLGNSKKVLQFLSERLSGKTIEMKVEANGASLEVRASSQAEFLIAVQAAKDFIAKSI